MFDLTKVSAIADSGPRVDAIQSPVAPRLCWARSLFFVAVYMAITAGALASCATSDTAQSVATIPSTADTPLPDDVLAALTAAARGTPFFDDLDPQTAKTGRPLSPVQQRFDVRRYDLSVRVTPASKSIEGSIAVTFAALSSTDAIELDLDPDLDVRKAMLGGEELAVTRNADRIHIALATSLATGETATVTVFYGGKPHVALAPPWHGGFVWSEIEGTPWFATAVQTEGCDLWWPCKDSFADKPEEGVSVSVSAPRGVKIASVGTLAGVDQGSDGFDTWRWESRHPYAGYAIAINGGPYEVVELEYAGVNGARYPVQFWALANNADKARGLLQTDALADIEFFERLLGPYPWGDEKLGFVETPHLGMEHQTINGYGAQYARGKHGFDQLLHHELAHEWFGNLMTHERPQDGWLHEGYGSYMQSVYAQETIGLMGYFDRMYGAYENNEHCDPVVNPAVEDVGEAFDNRDIYTKGAWLLHTLRRYIGDEAFWVGTRRLLYGTRDPWSLSYPIESRYRSTEDFIRIMSEESGEDVAWLVEAYLYEAAMPDLQVLRENGQITLRWQLESDRSFPMPVSLLVDGELVTLSMREGTSILSVPPEATVIIDPNSDLLRALPIIGDCSEQTEEQVNANIERFTRMAREYGWQRR